MNLRALITSLLLSLFIVGASSCKKEDPLSARNDLAGAQEYDININPKDSTLGGIGGGNGGGTGGSGAGFNEYFSAVINGVGASFDIYTYDNIGSTVVFSGTNSGNNHKINFSILGTISNGQTLSLDGSTNSASYLGSGSLKYSERGTLYIDSITADFIKGTFFFDASDFSNPLDSVIVTSGAFKFEI